MALLLLTACDDSQAQSAGEGGAPDLRDVGAQQLAQIAPDQLAQHAQPIVDGIAARLRTLRDAKDARELVDASVDRVDEMIALRDELLAQQVDFDALVLASGDAVARHGNDQRVMSVLQPFLDKLKLLR
jgi:hypothetical protein